MLKDRELPESLALTLEDDIAQLQALHDLAEYLEHQLGMIVPGTATLAALLKVAVHNELTLRLGRAGRAPVTGRPC